MDRINNSKKPKITNKQRIMAQEVYSQWLSSIYPIDSFELQDENGKTLYFYHGYNSYAKRHEPQDLAYHLRDEEFKRIEAERIARNLRGEEPENQKAENEYYSAVKAYIRIRKQEKVFSFYVPSWSRGEYMTAKAIYKNILHILEILGIEDREDYKIQYINDPEHIFLKRMQEEELAEGAKRREGIGPEDER